MNVLIGMPVLKTIISEPVPKSLLRIVNIHKSVFLANVPYMRKKVKGKVYSRYAIIDFYVDFDIFHDAKNFMIR